MKRRRKRHVRKVSKITPPFIFRFMFLEKIWKWFCWVTNNEVHPKHEVEFDIVFFIINTIVVLGGIPWFLSCGKETAPFLTLLLIEYTWALDTLRHNRTYIK